MPTPDPFPRDELNDLERRLSGWAPAPPSSGRDRMLFEAGRAAARSEARVRLTASLAATLAAVSVGLGGWAVHERTRRQAAESALAERPRVREAATVVEHPPDAPPIVEPGSASYLALTHRLATVGLDGPEPSGSPPVAAPRPAGQGRPLTPLSTRRPEGLMDL